MAIPSSGDDLIAAIYDVIIEPSRWDEVVNRIVEATKSMSGGLLMEGERSTSGGACGMAAPGNPRRICDRRRSMTLWASEQCQLARRWVAAAGFAVFS
jgi:hypothetical protein